jgi:hypothetical protein
MFQHKSGSYLMLCGTWAVKSNPEPVRKTLFSGSTNFTDTRPVFVLPKLVPILTKKNNECLALETNP